MTPGADHADAGEGPDIGMMAGVAGLDRSLIQAGDWCVRTSICSSCFRSVCHVPSAMLSFSSYRVCCLPAERAGPFRVPSFALLSFTRSCEWPSWSFVRYCVDWKTPLLSMAASVFLL